MPIKVCINPTCEEVALNCPIKVTSCANCGCRLVSISENLFNKKYKQFPHTHIDYSKPLKFP